MRFDYWFAYLGGIIFPESYVNNDWYAFHTSCDNVMKSQVVLLCVKHLVKFMPIWYHLVIEETYNQLLFVFRGYFNMF
jgi:hypothetical protein